MDPSGFVFDGSMAHPAAGGAKIYESICWLLNSAPQWFPGQSALRARAGWVAAHVGGILKRNDERQRREEAREKAPRKLNATPLGSLP